MTFFVLYWGASRAAIENVDTTCLIIRILGAAAVGLAILRATTGIPRTLRWFPVLIFGALFLLLSYVAVDPDDVADRSVRMLALFAVPAGAAHALVFGVYLALASAFGGHVGPAFAAQSSPHYKCFLRMRVAKNGLTIYPIAIDKVCRRWKWDSATARFEPTEGIPKFLARARASAPPINLQ